MYIGWKAYLWLPFIPLVVRNLIFIILPCIYLVPKACKYSKSTFIGWFGQQILLVIGTKLQVVIAKMGLQIQDRGDVVKGPPLVQPGDDLFWFRRPRLLLHFIHFVLFQVLIIYFFLRKAPRTLILDYFTLMFSFSFLFIPQNAFQLAFLVWTLVNHFTNALCL